MSAPAVALTAEVVFNGNLAAPSGDVPDITINAVPVGGLFDLQHPRCIVQTSCNVALFSAPCGLSRAQWTCSATYSSSPSFNAITVHIGAYGSGIVSLAIVANWLANGAVTIITGGKTYVLGITSNDASDGSDNIVIYLDRTPPVAPSGGDVVTFVPACDGKWNTCKSFGNGVNFRAFPWAPSSSPAQTMANWPVAPAGKK